MEECNWLQALEGGIDTSHFTILHRALKKDARQAGIEPDNVGVRGSAPSLEVDFTDYGYRYFGDSSLGREALCCAAITSVMPFAQLRCARRKARRRFTVTIGCRSTTRIAWCWNFYWSYGDKPIGDREMSSMSGNAYGTHVDTKNGFRSLRNRSNDWGIDRAMQKTETSTPGIPGINQQDRAVQESMGRIIDRSRENLGPADRAVVATRKLLIEAVDTVRQGGDPPGVGTGYY